MGNDDEMLIMGPNSYLNFALESTLCICSNGNTSKPADTMKGPIDAMFALCSRKTEEKGRFVMNEIIRA